MVEYLIELGCDPQRLDNEGLRPLAVNHSPEVLRFLLKLPGSNARKREGVLKLDAWSHNPVLRHVIESYPNR